MPVALRYAIRTGQFRDRSNRTSVSVRATGRFREREDGHLYRIRNTMTCALASCLLQMSTVAGTDLIVGGTSPAFAMTPEENSVIRLFEDSRQGVVYITNLAFRRDAFTTNQLEVPQGAGSGIVWPTKDPEGGIVVTNFHVVRGSADILVALNESEESVATIVGVDEDKDIAVLKLQKPLPSMKPVKLAGTTKTLKVGMKAYAIGNPFGLDHTLTAGVISGLGRELASAATGRPIMDVIQTDCSINPGNSGGPLLNSNNEVIGINTAIFSSTGMNAGVGFAINIDDVRDSVEQILKNGKVSRPLIGITFAPEPAVDQLGIQGVLVVSAKPGSPAEAAGIKGTERDEYGRLVLGDIITAINGQQVKSTSDLFKTLNRCKVGDEIQLQLQRGNEAIQVSLTLTSSS